MVPVAQETTANTVRLPYSFSRRFSLVAWCEASLEILHVHPLSLSVLQELQRGLNAPFTLRQIDEAEFEQRLNAVWQRDSSEARQLMEDLGSAEDFFTLAEELPETEDLLESDDDAPIIKLINAMLAEAIKEGASDIHIETFEKSLVIRFRVDGTLHEMLRPGRKLASLLVSRIKVMARLDIAEKRVPQDGRIALLLGGRAIDVRVSTMPSAWGERVVLRLLDKNQARLPVSTRTLIAMSDALQASGVYWLAGLLGLLVLGQRLLKNPAMRLRWDKTLLRLPVIGRVARGLNTARFSRTLSILTASSVPLLEGIQTAAAVSANRYVEQQLLLAADRVREGSSLRAALAELRLFPPMMLYMIASGEQSGELETMLEQAAVNQEREFDTQVGLALGLFEPGWW
ncbi:type II secretion system protein E [Escherichia coli]|uniref:Type II secretion system protein E n=1 Tax=Escherichia coli TaxID=562 RepID=A0A377C2D6_ECOLX|nr:type II secretion system protein E [Escherichia coli]